ncbi:RDD family protein [Streptomyces sp. DSM 42041]|uniref:RDD family protein n=1 Tax=Streptomyces hazeniae TaxID=3075538 RepID=A0ABU2NLM3_9ACTN|nr:RDD family protein [Streptomyces sp. DSM 42041]MDT0377877.1 RDD family protein [Streptomyces sp. DSM 42041]
MSAPSAGSANGSPVPGYYPDPSIPGYIRYWNGTAWVAGTSRPAPGPGEPAPAPPAETGGNVPAPRGAEPEPEAPDEDEDDSDEIDLGRASSGSSALPEVRRRGEVAAPGPDAAPYADWNDPRRLHGNQPEAATAWQADPGRQSGFGADQQDLSWGAPQESAQSAQSAHGGGQDPRAAWEAQEQTGGTPPPAGSGGQAAPDHTVGIRMPRPQQEEGARPAAQPEHTVGLRRSDVFQYGAAADAARQAAPAESHPPQQHQHQHQPQHPHPQHQAPAYEQVQQQAPHAQQQAQQTQAYQAPHAQQSVPQQYGGQAPQTQHAPQGAERPPWEQQSGGAASGQDGVAPWRPPAANPFADAVQEARPAGLGKRLGARIVDGLVVSAVTGAVAFPFVGRATEHIQDKIEATNQAGVTRTVWLIDGTTGVHLAVVLGAFLLFGLLYEALPTAKWGRTAGKKLFGLQVLDVEGQDTPGTGAALRRWLTYSLLSLVVLGVVNVLWCLFDRPWRQCWHDKAARTFVADR